MEEAPNPENAVDGAGAAVPGVPPKENPPAAGAGVEAPPNPVNPVDGAAALGVPPNDGNAVGAGAGAAPNVDGAAALGVAPNVKAIFSLMPGKDGSNHVCLGDVISLLRVPVIFIVCHSLVSVCFYGLMGSVGVAKSGA